jgi:hypothetical protein
MDRFGVLHQRGNADVGELLRDLHHALRARTDDRGSDQHIAAAGFAHSQQFEGGCALEIRYSVRHQPPHGQPQLGGLNVRAPARCVVVKEAQGRGNIGVHTVNVEG